MLNILIIFQHKILRNEDKNSSAETRSNALSISQRVKKALTFKCSFLWRAHSNEQTPFSRVFSSSTHLATESTEEIRILSSLLKDTTY